MGNSEDYIIQVKNLIIDFSGFKAVNDISFSVKRGEIFGFLGANGAGKTTTIRTLCGLLNPSSGKVFVNGKDVSSSINTLKPLIGYMSQKFTLYPDLTMEENMYFAGALYRMTNKQIKARCEELFKFIEMPQIPQGPVQALSGGTRQILSLAASLIHNPELIFLDEPTAGASVQTRAIFWKLINNLAANGKTIFVTTHYMDEAEKCNRIVLMDKGKIIAADTPIGLKKKYFPTDMYELTFLKEEQKNIGALIEKNNLGSVSYFGQKLHIKPLNAAALHEWIKAQETKDIFTYKTIEPSLEDVFLQALMPNGVKNEQ